jgi:hypothetical protein
MTTTETTIHTLAGEAYSWLEQRQRDDGEYYWVIKDGAPDWMQPLVYQAHGSMMPDDDRYCMIAVVLREIECADDIDDAREQATEPPIYTSERLRWLASHLDRVAYVDDAVSEMGGLNGSSIVDAIAWGWSAEAGEVFDLVVSALEDRLSDEETDAA